MLKSLAIGDEVTVMDHNIDVHIGTIRRKLGARRDLIETLRGVGYRFRD
jgi:DNA-binding response OmpR family regulator